MNVNPRTTSSPADATRRFGRKAFVVSLAGGAFLVAGLVLGHGVLSRVSDAGSVSRFQPVTAPVTSGDGFSRPSTGYSPHTVYIVASDELADSVRASLTQANVARENAGAPPDEVVVAQSDEEAATIVAAVTTANRILAADSNQANLVVDLRDSPAPAGKGALAGTRQNTTWVYIVGSEAEATELRAAAASVPGSNFEIMVVGSRDDANAAANFLRGVNPVGEASGPPWFKVMILGALAGQ